MSWLDAFLRAGYTGVSIAGTAVPQERTLNLLNGASAVDNPTLGRTDVTLQPSGITSVSTTGGTTNVTSAALPVVEITGTLTSNATVNLPNTPGVIWALYNGTSGAFTVTVQVTGGTGFAVGQGKRCAGYVNGSTTLVRVSPDT